MRPSTKETQEARRLIKRIVKDSSRKGGSIPAWFCLSEALHIDTSSTGLAGIEALFQWIALWQEFGRFQKEFLLRNKGWRASPPSYETVVQLLHDGIINVGGGASVAECNVLNTWRMKRWNSNLKSWGIEHRYARFIAALMERLYNPEMSSRASLVSWLKDPSAVCVEDQVWVFYHSILFLHLMESNKLREKESRLRRAWRWVKQKRVGHA